MNPFALPLHTLSFSLLLTVPGAILSGEDPKEGGAPPSCAEINASDQYGPTTAIWVSGSGTPRLRVQKAVLGAGDSLASVEVSISGSVSGSLGFENTTANPCVAFPEWSISIGVQPTVATAGLPPVPFESSQLLTVSLEPSDGVVDYGGASGATVTLPPGLSFLREFSLTQDLEAFVDSVPGDGQLEYFEFDHFALGDGSVESSCGAEVLWTSEATLRVEFLYTICSTAEPCPAQTVLEKPVVKGALPVDARELAILYDVRDKLLTNTPEGRVLTARFYRHALEAHVLFLNHPDLRLQAANLLRSLLPKLADATRGLPATLTDAEERSIDSLIRALEPHATPDLLRTLEGLRRDLERGKLTGPVGLRR